MNSYCNLRTYNRLDNNKLAYNNIYVYNSICRYICIYVILYIYTLKSHLYIGILDSRDICVSDWR